MTVLGTTSRKEHAQSYGCIVSDESTLEVLHYVEKPQSFVSTDINSGMCVGVLTFRAPAAARAAHIATYHGILFSPSLDRVGRTASLFGQIHRGSPARVHRVRP